MTHPRDKVYRFRTLSHWGQGYAENLLFGAAGDDALSTPSRLVACKISDAPKGEEIRRFAYDVGGRLIWLVSDGSVWAYAAGTTTWLSSIAPHLTENVRSVIWGQEFGWIASDGDLTRLDTRTGDRMGNFAAANMQAVGAVPDLCDGVVVIEEKSDRGPAQLRRILTDGRAQKVAMGCVHDVCASCDSGEWCSGGNRLARCD